MAEKEQITKEKVDNSGLFDFAALYGFAHSWLKDQEGYGVVEEKYSEKVSGNSRDIDVEWKATKGVTDYFRIELGVKFEVRGLTDVEVEVDGAKRKMNRGKVSIDIKGTLIKDPDSKWESSPLNRFMRDVYNKYIIPSRLLEMKGRVSGDVVGFKDNLKAFLDLTGKR
ncbi:hypothetical protein KW787_00900 [Candidatus Pacearchaeota archaeon]|nr:hypothetical protein [Candidatus Pacearchaeota archaeon]